MFTVLGGIQITKHIKYLIQRKELTRIVDCFVVGDGEEPLAKLIYQFNKNKSLKEVPNLYFKAINIKKKYCYIKSNSSYSYNPKEGLIIPDFSGFKIRKVLPIRASIGCPWSKCTFCTYKNAHKKNVYLRPEDIICLIKTLIRNYKVNHFWFVDDALDAQFLKRFSHTILDNNLKILWTAYINLQPKLLDESFVKLISKAGCEQIIIGLESVSPRVLELMNKSHKSMNTKEIKSALMLLKKHNIDVLLLLMIGFPSETKEEAQMTLDFLINKKRLYSLARIQQFSLEDDTLILKNPDRFAISKIYKNNKNCGSHLGFYYKTYKGMTVKEIEEFVKQRNQ